MPRFVLVQLPMFQEDEGRGHLLSIFNSQHEAEACRDKYVTESRGYFNRSNFAIMQSAVR